jgi:serine/threonine protein kinase
LTINCSEENKTVIRNNLVTFTCFIYQIAREIMIHKELNHVNVVQMHHYFEDNLNVYMLLEACPKKVTSIIDKNFEIIKELKISKKFFMILLVIKK